MVDHMTDRDSNPVPCNADQNGEKKNRRRFLGAGAAASPFLLTFVSQPALGVACFTPSRSLSKNTSLSQQDHVGECTGAESPGNYKAQQDPSSGAYHWPASVPPTTAMHPLFQQGSQQGVTKFTKWQQGSGEISKTLGEALQVNAAEQVHFHVIGAYLNIMGGNGAVIPPNVMTKEQLLEIWRQFATTGRYEVSANVYWNGGQIVDYLKNNGLVK